MSTNHERIDKERSTCNVQIMGTDGAANVNAMIEYDRILVMPTAELDVRAASRRAVCGTEG